MLQLAQATAILVNNGVKRKPQLVIGTQDTLTAPGDPPARRPSRWTSASSPRTWRWYAMRW
jgi:penicillin-binding protein 2